ncbi:polymer-forming cytoskeletal protein [Candidatus Amarobacter glycogenicus]|uniref:bactofilin family protein n=1 Tax=Candidatus Amarobacter glycogenicus TaxID=3140699 RepID=UPI003135E312|nr:polymer-forming cytoskeletal protein [Dehalococcoidia bacterium]
MQIKKSPRDSEFPRIPTFENADYEVENSAQMEDRAPGAFNVRPSRPAAAAADETTGPGLAAGRSQSVVDRHSSFDGHFETEHDLRVEGTVSGEVVCHGLFTVERDATARARVQAQDAHIHGRMEGDLVCAGKLVLSGTAQVTGTLKAALLVIEEGATVSGTVETLQASASPRKVSAEPVAARENPSEVAHQPATVTRPTRRDLPSFAIVSSDERATADRN